MPRPPRIHFDGALYHAIARGNGSQKTVLDEKDYQGFVDGLGELKRTTPFSVYAYCLMPNHFLCGAPHNVCYVKFHIM